MTPHVVVIGAGAAGLMAAIAAREAGAHGDAGRAHRRRRPQDPHQRRRPLQRAAARGRARNASSATRRARWCGRCSAPGRCASSGASSSSDLGLPLALEADSGKLFPASNRARDVRDGLVARARAAGRDAALRHRGDRRAARQRRLAGRPPRPASWPGDAGGHRHRRAVGAGHRQRRLRPGSGPRARSRGAAHLRGADAAHGHAGRARGLVGRVARRAPRGGVRPRAGRAAPAGSCSRTAATAGRPCSTCRTWRCAASGRGRAPATVRVAWTPMDARRVATRTGRRRAAGWRRRSRATCRSGSPTRWCARPACPTTAPACSCGATSATALLRSAHRVPAAVDRRRGLPHGRGHRRRRGARRGAPRHAREPARARPALLRRGPRRLRADRRPQLQLGVVHGPDGRSRRGV